MGADPRFLVVDGYAREGREELAAEIPEIEELDFEIPMMIDLEGFTYMRQERNGLLVGIYEIDHKHWNMDGAPWDYGIELLTPEPDRISNEISMAMTPKSVLNTG